MPFMATDLIPPTPFEFIALTSTLSSCCGSLSSLQCSPGPLPPSYSHPFSFSFPTFLSSLYLLLSSPLLKIRKLFLFGFLVKPFFLFCYSYAPCMFTCLRFFWRDKRLLSWEKKKLPCSRVNNLIEGGKRDIGPVQSKTRSQCLHRACDFD